MKNLKKILAIALILATLGCVPAFAAAGAAAATQSSPEFATYLTQVKTCQYFTDDAVPSGDITTILNAGINAQSGMNQQPWHFSAIASKDVQNEIADEMGFPAATGTSSKAMMADAPLAIVVSCTDGNSYDAGLATQAMNACALALGYATKIISSPTNVINGENQAHYRSELGIPSNMSAVGILLVGKPLDTSDIDPDTITGPTTRNPYSEVVTLVN